MNKIFKVVLTVFAASWIIKEILIPLTAAALYSNQYISLVYQCDTAMEASWYYTQDKTFDKRSETIQLLSCHEYDLIRKKMLISGLPEEYLSWLGLKSLEIYQRPAEEYVKQHRFIQR